MKIAQILSLLLFPISACVAQNNERILSFDSEVTVHENTSLTVRETIRVNALGQQIRRGIYRNFPTRYRDRFGNNYNVGFEVESVTRNGHPEKFVVENMSNGKRIRIGQGNVFLPSGEHTFQIVYRTTRQLGLFEGHDELYWNVTGTGWLFPIDKVTATVQLPDTIDSSSMRLDGFTGPQGATEKAFESEVKPNEPVAVFATTESLQVAEGLTILVGWPKGHVTAPNWLERTSFFLHDNPATTRAVGGFALVTAYFLVAWLLIGRDPRKGTIIPRFHPPKGLSPAACRFVHKMGFDNNCFASALISLAVKGVLKITEYKNGVVSLKKQHSRNEEMSPGEDALFSEMMPYEESMALTQTNHAQIKRGVDALKDSLEDEFETHYFFKNIGWFVPGVLLASGFTIWALIALLENQRTFFLTLVVGVVLTGTMTFVYRAFRRSISIARMIGAALGLVIFGMILIFIFVGPFVQFETISITFLTVVMSIGLVCLLFYELLKRPTIHGRRTMDDVEGFRTYLKTAETDRLAAMHPPGKTPELFERYLPYALALGVEQEWAESFSQMLIAAANSPESNTGYVPVWYHSYSGGSYDCFNPSALTTSVSGSLTTSIASASTPPGSTSGFGDSSGGSGGGFGGFGGGGFGGGFSGGFSGGGGGGGGGGGW